jgi:hypothetical protein
MADKPKLTEEMTLPPGVVVTPGYAVPEPPRAAATMSDRRIAVHTDAEGRTTVEVAEHPILSTHGAAAKAEPAKAPAAR